jgi:hypothetical protein
LQGRTDRGIQGDFCWKRISAGWFMASARWK